jgi:hypothetical protein
LIVSIGYDVTGLSGVEPYGTEKPSARMGGVVALLRK